MHTAVGSSRAQIVKSLVFICDGRPTLALVPGDRRADELKVAAAAGARYARVARPDEVLAATGFELAWGVLFDLIHHRGQLSTYLRPMGSTVPAIYGPSADEES